MSYSHTLLDQRNSGIFSCSVPPSCHPSLSKNFKEISRIHFYFGRASIDFMIDEVESSSLESIYLGMPQLAFSIKEVMEYIPFNNYGYKEKDVSYFLNTMVKDLCHNLKEVLKDIFNSPKDKENIEKLNILSVLFAELQLLEKSSKGFNSKDNEISKTKNYLEKAYKDIEKLKEVYPDFNDIKKLDIVKNEALLSIKEQLRKNFSFDIQEVLNIYDVYANRDEWISHLKHLIYFIEKEPQGYKNQMEDLKDKKDAYVKNMRAFSQVLKNGVINYMRSFLVALSYEKYRAQSMIDYSCDSYYENAKESIKRNIDNPYSRSKDKDIKKLDYLVKNKDEYIKNKMIDKRKAEEELFRCHSIERNIIIYLKDLEKEIIGIKEDIKSNSNKLKIKMENNKTIKAEYKDYIIYAINDDLTSRDMGISVFSMKKEDFNNISNDVLNNTSLLRDKVKDFKNIKFTNFQNMPSFINSLKNNFTQEYFLGEKNIELESDFMV